MTKWNVIVAMNFNNISLPLTRCIAQHVSTGFFDLRIQYMYFQTETWKNRTEQNLDKYI